MERARSILERGIQAGALPGAVVYLRQHGETLWHEALGTTDGAAAVRTDTLYDLASLTKPLATAATVSTLLEHGELLLATPVTAFLPSVRALSEATVFHLLTHTSGLPAWAPCYGDGEGLEAAVEAIAKLPLKGDPGTRYEYSCLGYILLARIIETITGTSLATFAAQNVFAPLGLTSLTFTPEASRCAPTIPQEGSRSGETLQGVVHDGNARAISAGGAAVSGNAGLFGTAADVARFGEAILHGGFLGSSTRQRWLQPQSTPPGHTLAFFCKPNGYTPTGELLSDQAVGHSGFTGTVLTLDPATDSVIVLLSNAVFLDNNKAEFLPLRRRFFNAVAGDL